VCSDSWIGDRFTRPEPNIQIATPFGEVEAMKGEVWESPRGPGIDPQRRDIMQNVYLWRAEKAGNPLANIEFAIYANVKTSK
jgi:hypothetical protein